MGESERVCPDLKGMQAILAVLFRRICSLHSVRDVDFNTSLRRYPGTLVPERTYHFGPILYRGRTRQHVRAVAARPISTPSCSEALEYVWGIVRILLADDSGGEQLEVFPAKRADGYSPPAKR